MYSGIDGRIFQAHKLLERLCQQRSLPFPAKAQEVMPAGSITAATIIQEADRIKQVRMLPLIFSGTCKLDDRTCAISFQINPAASEVWLIN